MTNLDQQFSEVLIKQHSLEAHPVFSAIKTLDDLRVFMSWHVFAVWDFMSLLKQLQRKLTCVDLPWVPPANPVASRLINEIVLGEECDEMPGGGHLSHFEIYLLAMREIGADTRQIEDFVRLIRAGTSVEMALQSAGVDWAVSRFVTSTLNTAITGSVNEVLGSFFFGRENVIPAMFRSLLAQWQVDEKKTPVFVYYLNRHIELDGDSHGPATWNIIKELVGDDPFANAQVKSAAEEAINARRDLWDGLAACLKDINAQPLEKMRA
ncbi:MAG: DUF3050 domain-containing protein [Gammaproteobacteria bacterium]|nr:DUF3050 domain-containing protein [Gammaproteobacteria bacterium]MBU1978601.1 DUF3050 domain-containing protein [Gammaproteobacteria bacterium]